MNDPTINDDVKSGMKVEIEKQRSKILVIGIIKEIISKGNHPDGIFVQLMDGNKGRVKKIIDSKILKIHSNNSEYLLEPESTTVEYKQYFIYYHSFNQKPENSWVVEHSIYKTIAAFANSVGGKLIIGIHDNGKIFGLENDYGELARLKEKNPKSIYKPNRDGMELKIKSDCNHYFKENPKYALDLIKKITFPVIENKEICEIEISPSYEMPLILYDDDSTLSTKKGPAFYVRKGNSSEHYTLHEFLDYWVRRIKNHE